MDFGHEHLGWENNCRQAQILLKNWEIAWENKNVRSHPHTPDAHADHYRAQWDQLAFLYYLRHPEKAPASDWINETPSTLPPLTLLARRPDIALLWEQDPFFELIDKGAEINSDLLKVVISSATAPSRTDEEQKVQASRARNLLKAGVECPSGLSDQEKAWLQSIKS